MSPIRCLFPFLLMTLPATAAPQSPPASPSPTLVYLGGYSRPAQPGIQLATFNPATGSLTDLALAAELRNPSFLALHPNGRTLLAVTETAELDNQPGGGITALGIDPATGQLQRWNTQSTRGAGPCHVAVDPTGRVALVANYGGGSVTSFLLQPDGHLSPAVSFHQHHGSGADPSRQQGPHAHGVYVDQTSRFVLVPDLGLDQVVVYQLNQATGVLTPNDPPFASLPPGSGPRHLAFDPSQRHVYVINELSSTVTAMTWDPATGQLAAHQHLPTLPADFSGSNTTAEIAVSNDGRFLYASNRGHDSIAIFSIDPGTGNLQLAGFHSTGGRTPRHFSLSPAGDWLLAANQNSDNLVALRRDAATGLLRDPQPPVPMPAPSCILFLHR